MSRRLASLVLLCCGAPCFAQTPGASGWKAPADAARYGAPQVATPAAAHTAPSGSG